MISPLAGVKVVDFTRILAGPFCTMLLSDLGATVYKIEKPGPGDDTRMWRPPDINGQSSYFLCVNRNKSAMYRAAFFGYGLGYGQKGPYVKRGGYDIIAAAIGGFLHITGHEGGEPCKPGTAVTDMCTGLYAHGAITAALLQRYKTGLGQKIDCNLLSTQVSMLINVASNYLNCGLDGRRLGTAHESVVPYQAFRTVDGYFVVGGNNDKQFEELCRIIDRTDLFENPKFETNALRVTNRDELLTDLKSVFLSKTNGQWAKLFENSRLAFGPVNSIGEVFEDPQVQYNEMVQSVQHAKAGVLKLVAPAVKFSQSENAIRAAPPMLGEHTAQILRDVLRMSSVEIDRLANEHVVQLGE